MRLDRILDTSKGMFMEEQWKDIKDYEGLYQISSLGRVKSLAKYVRYKKAGNAALRKERVMKCGTTPAGYCVASLSFNKKTKGITVHRLVATHFLSNPNKYPQINHIDGNKKNNTAPNLEWCDQAHNMRHAYNIGLLKPKRGAESSAAKITNEIALKIVEMLKNGLKYQPISDKTGANLSMIAKINNHSRWRHLTEGLPNPVNSCKDVHIERMYSALQSIASNTCCDKCQEAALVAQKALGLDQRGLAKPKTMEGCGDKQLIGITR